MKVEIYSDVVCPWCRIGARRFQRALEAFDDADEVEVVFRPFQLDPSAPEAPEPIRDRLERKYGPNAGRMLESAAAAATEEGLEMRWDDAKSVNTLRAHRLMEWALDRGGAEAQHGLADELFAAHFERGQDVGDPDTLASLADAAGLDGEAARTLLASDEGLEATRNAIEEALRMGIRSVPTFVLEGRWAVQGAQPAATLTSVLQKVHDELTSEA